LRGKLIGYNVHVHDKTRLELSTTSSTTVGGCAGGSSHARRQIVEAVCSALNMELDFDDINLNRRVNYIISQILAAIESEASYQPSLHCNFVACDANLHRYTL
jgi:hypothetical protein